MKKTRLISLLLTAALALSSMPIMVSAAKPANQRIDVLANATIEEDDVTDVTDLTIGSGNKYLHVYRTLDSHGFSYTPSTAMEAGKTYYIEFDARNAVENDIVAGVENQFRMRAGLTAGSGTAHWATKAATNPDPVNQPDLVADDAIKGDVDSFGGTSDFNHIAYIRNGWIHYTLAITADASSVGLWFYGGATADATGAASDIQIDNFRFYEDGTTGVTIDFEDVEVGDTAPGFGYRHHINDPAQIPAPTVVESADYTKAASGAVTYVINQDIAGGSCPFTGEVRYGVYHADATLPNKANNVTVIAVVDGTEWTIASARDVKDWTDLSAVAQLPAGYLSEVKVVSEDAAALDSAIHLKNFSFKVPVEVKPFGGNLLENATPTAAGDVVAKTDIDVIGDADIDVGDYYLSVTNRGRGADTQGLNVLLGNYLKDYKAGQTWYMTFDARVPVESNAPAYVRARLTIGTGNQPFWTSSDNVGDNLNIAYGGWKSYKLKFTNAKDLTVSSDYRVWFRDGFDNGVSGFYHQPFDMDNVQFWAEDAEGNEIAGTRSPLFTFEDGQAGNNFTSRGGATIGVNKVDPDSFTRIIGEEAGTPIVATYNLPAIPADCTADIAAAVRFAYWHGTESGTGYVDSTNVELILDVNGVETVLASMSDVKDLWETLEAADVKLKAGDVVKLIIKSDTDLAIDIKNVKFEVPEMAADEKGQMPNIGIVMVLLAKKRAAAEGNTTSVFTVNGAALNTKNVKAVEGNKYLEVSERNTNTTGIKLVTVPAAGDYTLEFDIRSSVDLEIVKDAGIDFNTDAAGDVIRIRTASDTTVFTDFEKDDWKTFSYGFSADGLNAVGVEIYGGYYYNQSMPFDIDNIVIKDANGVAIYTENFDALEAEDFGTSIALSGTTTADNAVSIVPRVGTGNTASYAIIAEDAYVTAKVADNSVVSYNAEALAAGNYVAKGYIRNSYFNANGSEKSDADAAINSTDYLSLFAADTTFTYNGEEVTAAAGFIGLNKNQFALKVSVGAETASYKVTSRWTAFEVPFTVAEGDAAPVVNFEIDHDMPYTMGDKELVPFDLKVEIVPAQ